MKGVLFLGLFYLLLGFAAASYSTQEVMVPMRDGVKLYTVVYTPNPSGQRLATVLMRTPYGTDSLAQECEQWAGDRSLNCVAQDFRGRYKSEGKFEIWLNASTDGYDTMAWITKQSWSDSKRIFTTGGSANGIAEYLQPISNPPWLLAQEVVVGTANLHPTFYQGGAFRQSLSEGWLDAIKEPQIVALLLKNEANGPFWLNTTLGKSWKNVRGYSVHYGGWFDIFSQHTLNAYNGYRYNSSAPALGNAYLIMSPGGHCQQGELYPWPNTTYGFDLSWVLAGQIFKMLSTDDVIEQQQLKAKLQEVPKLVWYVMGPGYPGSHGNYWTSANDWPQTVDFKLYLDSDGRLSYDPPKISAGSQSFVYRPENPVPTLGGNNLLLHCGPYNQTIVESRSDVLTFTSPPLTADLTITGHMYLDLWVSSNATDTDFTAKLTDVWPFGGVSSLVQDSIIRMRWRDSDTSPKLMKPGEIYKVTIDLWSTSYIFNAGHSIRLDISSSNFPRFSVNPNNGLPVYQTGANVTALNTVHFGSSYPTVLHLPMSHFK